MAEIKAEPFAFPAKHDQLALIVIDMQRDFAEPGGFGASLGNDVNRITRIVPEVKRLIQGFRHAGLPVIHTATRRSGSVTKVQWAASSS